MNIQKNIQLQTLNTMATPAVAKWFAVIQHERDIPELMAFCQQQQCDFLVIGEGSNSLFASDLNLLVIANRIGGAGIIPDLFKSQAVSKVLSPQENSEYVELKIGAGVGWHQLVEQSLQHGYYGLERLALIPGLVGGAPIQNIGAYGSEVSEVIVNVKAYDIQTNKFRVFENKDCQFSYRDSIFKQQAGRFIITEVTMRLLKQSPVYAFDSLYPALKDVMSATEHLDAQVIFQTVCKVRQSKLPSPSIVPNAGSFFKNPVISQQQYEVLKQQYPNMVSYVVPEGIKLAAAWLIDHSGFKGFSNEKGIGCYEKQALVIVNPDKNRGQDILKFANVIRNKVKQNFSVELEIEPRLYQAEASRLICQS